jgi:3-oxoacyl-[acyl-carrier-protein] synthase II
MERRQIVISGIGAVSAVGIGANTFFDNLSNGVSGIGKITHYDASPQASQIAGEIKGFAPEDYFSKKMIRRTGRYIQFGLLSAHEAVENAQLKLDDEDATRMGCLFSSGIGDFPMAEESVLVYHNQGAGKMSPFTTPRASANMVSANISLELGLKGPSLGLTSACTSGAHAIAIAAIMLQAGHADVIIAGAAESCLSPAAVESYIALRALSTRNENPTRASRPFDKDRDGFVIAEGAAALVMETREHAEKRGAPILAELAGCALNCDAYHITAPHPQGDGATNAMLLALQNAGLAIDDVDYINAHGTSTPINDPSETNAIKRAFGDRAYDIPVSSIKSMIGHSLGASGALEAVTCVKAMQENLIPPTINLDNPDPLCDLDYVPHTSRKKDLNVVLSNSFGFGGQNCVLAFKKFDK